MLYFVKILSGSKNFIFSSHVYRVYQKKGNQTLTVHCAIGIAFYYYFFLYSKKDELFSFPMITIFIS